MKKIFSVSISPDRQYAITGSRDKSVKLWRIDENGLEERHRLRFKQGVTAVEFLEEHLVAVGFENGSLSLAEIRDNKEMIAQEFPQELFCGKRIQKIRRINDLEMKKFAVCSDDHTVRIYSY